jgi:hypothetical protein
MTIPIKANAANGIEGFGIEALKRPERSGLLLVLLQLG